MRWSWAVPILRGRQVSLGLPTAARFVVAFGRRLGGRDERLGVVQEAGPGWTPGQGSGEVLTREELRWAPEDGDLLERLARLGEELDRLAASGGTLAAADPAALRVRRPGGSRDETVPLWTGALVGAGARGYLGGWVDLHAPRLAGWSLLALEARGRLGGGRPPALTLCLPRDLVQTEPEVILVPASLSG